jgi:exodeoxyribonuclease VII small subunit
MNDSPPDELTFEQALSQLETIVRELEDGQTGLEQALARYETGIGLLRRCYGQLRAAEQRILLLTGEGAEGQALTRPFQHTATVPEKEADDKADKTKRRKKGSNDGAGW